MAKFCSGCGSPLGEAVRFCRACGQAVAETQDVDGAHPTQIGNVTRVDPSVTPVPLAGTPTVPVPAHVNPNQAAHTSEPLRVVQEIVGRLDLGQRLVAGGAAAAVLGFLLPQWQYGGGGISAGGGYILRLIFALALLGLVYYRERVDERRRLTLTAIQLALASAYAIEFFDVLSGSGYGVGFYLMAAGFAVAVAGAFTSINGVMQVLSDER